MAATILDGAALAARLRRDLAEAVLRFADEAGRRPGLAVFLVGDDPASAVYVRNKERAAAEVGIASQVERLPATTSQAELLGRIGECNADPGIDGILVQWPVPPHIDFEAVVAAISPEKDVDGFHPLNLGRLARGLQGMVACTPKGVMELLRHHEVPLRGRRAVVLGRSNTVGKPLAQLLLGADVTVTVCHSQSADLPGICREADLLIAAVGRPELVRGDWVKPGAAVVDVGINRVDGRLVGDVAFAEAVERAGAITPVPGGVGPMTIAMLLANTLQAAEQALQAAGAKGG